MYPVARNHEGQVGSGKSNSAEELEVAQGEPIGLPREPLSPVDPAV